MVAHAIPFGQSADGALGDNKAFPYIYNFVNSMDDPQTIMGGIGPVVVAGATVKHIVAVDSDYNFFPRWLRLTIYYLNVGAGTYEWWDTPPTSPILVGNPLVDRLSDFGVPLAASIGVTLTYLPDARSAFGDQQPNSFTPALPIPLPLLQGEDAGIRSISVPYMLPAQGKLVFALTNSHATKDLFVGGCVFGWKVRL